MENKSIAIKIPCTSVDDLLKTLELYKKDGINTVETEIEEIDGNIYITPCENKELPTIIISKSLTLNDVVREILRQLDFEQ